MATDSTIIKEILPYSPADLQATPLTLMTLANSDTTGGGKDTGDGPD